jgi:hypothetical protein
MVTLFFLLGSALRHVAPEAFYFSRLALCPMIIKLHPLFSKEVSAGLMVTIDELICSNSRRCSVAHSDDKCSYSPILTRDPNSMDNDVDDFAKFWPEY